MTLQPGEPSNSIKAFTRKEPIIGTSNKEAQDSFFSTDYQTSEGIKQDLQGVIMLELLQIALSQNISTSNAEYYSEPSDTDIRNNSQEKVGVFYALSYVYLGYITFQFQSNKFDQASQLYDSIKYNFGFNNRYFFEIQLMKSTNGWEVFGQIGQIRADT